MGSINNINLQTTIGDLPLQDCQVSSNTMGQVLAHQFEQRADLVGVVVVDDSRLLGLISRHLYDQVRNNQVSNQHFIKNSVRTFLKSYQPQSVMVMGAQETIDRAVKNVLNRQHHLWYEPVVVVFTDDNLPGFKDFLLLDANLLLRAQYQLGQLLQRRLSHHGEERNNWSMRLKQQQEQTKSHQQSLDHYQEEVKSKEHNIKLLQSELALGEEQLNLLKQEIIQLQSLVSIEVDRACQFTYEGVDSICNGTGKVVEISLSLREDINSICGISELINELSNQFRHLAVQAAIITNNNPSIHMHGFSKISSEISKLVVQTLDVGRKTDRIAHNFRSRIDELTSSAETSTKIAYSLVDRMADVEQVFHDQLGYNYVQENKALSTEHDNNNQNSPNVVASDIKPPKIAAQERNEALANKIPIAQKNLNPSSKKVSHNESSPLVSKIKQVLEHQQSSSESVNFNHD